MKGTIGYCLLALAVFLVITSTALALVGDVGDKDLYIQPDQSLPGSGSDSRAGRSSSMEGSGLIEAYIPYQDGYTGAPGSSSNPSSSSSISPTYLAPSIGGPFEDRLTAEMLGLSIPQAESYNPDESLNFVSYQTSTMAASGAHDKQDPAGSGFQAGSGLGRMISPDPAFASSAAGSSDWYYPGRVSSSNRFYVQTASGLGTVAGCSYRGYLPLWADIRSKGNFFVYEWYPGEYSPLVRSWGWSEPGYKKGWFTGDVPGWHTICYYCGAWSNYIYIYVYPSMQSSAPSSSSSTYLAGEGAALQPAIPSSIPSTVPSPIPATIASSMTSLPSAGQPSMQQSMQLSLPAGAPMPPDIYSEQLALPNFNMYPPASSQAGYYIDHSAQKIVSPSAAAQYPVQGHPKALDGKTSSAKTTTTCTTSTQVIEGVYSSCPYADDSGCCQDDKISKDHDAPQWDKSKSVKAVFPKPSQFRCNEYYVLSCRGDTDTVAGVYSGEWIPLWSKISRPGKYWSYEWKFCHIAGGKGCNPEVRDFGHKSAGWYQTWFMGSEPGWHILSYYCNDWSNYVYIYVWPAN